MNARQVVAAALTGAALVVVYDPSAAGAAPTDAAESVTSYAGYPANEVPDGCDAADVTGVEFSLNGGTPTGDAQSLPGLRIGDEVTMTWAAVGADCAGAWLSLAIKEAAGATFDPTVDQRLLSPYAREVAAAGGGSVSLPIIQPVLETCFYQLDGIVGRPLAVVGPSGNYYSSSFSGAAARSDERSVLLGASNGQVPNCTPGTTTTTTGPPESTTSTIPATTSSAPTTTPPATAPSEPGPPASGVLTSSVPSLPATGASSGTLTAVGAGLLASGLVLVRRARKMAFR